MTKKEIALAAVEAMKQEYPDAICSLNSRNPLQLLIATRLSAQCTDARVNLVTPALFARFPTLDAFCAGSEAEIAEYIRSCGLYKTKARDIYAMCCVIRDRFGGEVPHTREELTELPGVGRKVANVVLSNAFGIPAIAVDTHVFRVANRLGLADASTVDKTEKQLMENIPQDKWSIAHHLIIFHGRRVCSAQKPKCEACALSPYCKAYRTKSF